ncbi:hypothetical protein GCM10023238_39310 [Streptomyces heliomycini]
MGRLRLGTSGLGSDADVCSCTKTAATGLWTSGEAAMAANKVVAEILRPA